MKIATAAQKESAAAAAEAATSHLVDCYKQFR